MEEKEIIQNIVSKKDFSKLPREEILRAYSHFAKREVSDKEKIRLTRELLHKVYGVFSSKKLLSLKDKDFLWVLRKHVSTRERISYYEELYSRIVEEGETIFDLGCGVNGFSFPYFPKDVAYFGVEAVGQLVELMNFYFNKENFSAKAIHGSLFNLQKIKKLIKKEKGAKKIFLFKVLDSLEMVERNYSKKLLFEIVPLAKEIVVSFATRSIGSRTKFRSKRNWILDFVKENFNLKEDFELGSERYVIFSK